MVAAAFSAIASTSPLRAGSAEMLGISTNSRSSDSKSARRLRATPSGVSS